MIDETRLVPHAPGCAVSGQRENQNHFAVNYKVNAWIQREALRRAGSAMSIGMANARSRLLGRGRGSRNERRVTPRRIKPGTGLT